MVTDWQDVLTYDGISLTHTLQTVTDAITSNSKYRFRVKAVNGYGSSEWSPTVDVTIAALPNAPVAPSKIQSTMTSIKVSWQAPSDDIEAPIGYVLYVEEGSNQQRVIYDGSQNPNLLEYNLVDLVAGFNYGFSVKAINFNGEGPQSPVAWYRACTAPYGLEVPTVLATTSTSIMFKWQSPAGDGGCFVSSYELYLDDGLGGDFVNTDSELIEDREYLREHTVELGAEMSGRTLRFKLKAVNEIGEAQSAISS